MRCHSRRLPPRLPLTTRLLGTTAAAALLLSLSACSGDEEPDSNPSEGDESSETASDPGDAPTRGEEPKQTDAKCDVSVEITGAATEAWEGSGQVRFAPAGGDPAGSAAVYLTERGKRSLRAYSEGSTLENAAVTFVNKGMTFGSNPENLDGIVVQKNAKGAEIDAELANVAGETVRVVASFDCGGKPKKG